MMGKGKMYVVVNEDLNMSAGKTAAQVAHVVSRLKSKPPKVVIVLQGTSEQLTNLRQYLNDNNIPCSYYIDEGVNEVPAMSLTAVAFGGVVEDFTPDFIANFGLYIDQTPYKLELREMDLEQMTADRDYYKKRAEEWRESYMKTRRHWWQR